MPKRKNIETPSRIARRMRRMSLRTSDDIYPRQKKAWMLIQLICLWWICALPRGKAKIHWAYVLSPPLLHPHTWVDEEVTVYVNDTRALGLPSSSHIALTCRNNVSVCNKDLCEWAPLERDGSPKDLIGGLFTQDHMFPLEEQMNPLINMDNMIEKKNVTVMACVPEPYVLLIGNFSISFSSPIYNTSCINCNITNCVTQGVDSVVILKQPSFVMLPVNLTQPWYKEKSEAILNRIISELARSKRFIGMMIAGIVALVTLVASASASAISLTQEINTAHFVNQLMFNVTTVMTAQEEWDQKIEQKLNILYDTVNLIGDELQQLETLQRLQCHYEYNHVCVTKALYNNTMFPWGQIKNHLQGIWHNCNTSLNLLRLHILIKSVQDAPKLDTQLMDTAHNIIASLKAHFLDINHWIYSVLGFGIGIILLLLMIMIFCVLLRLVQKTTKKLLRNIS